MSEEKGMKESNNISRNDDDDDKDSDEGNDKEVNEGTGKRKRKRKRKSKAAEAEPLIEVDTKGRSGSDESSKDLVERTIYVEGIPFDATQEQVKEFFINEGITDIAELRLPTWQDSGRLRGYGHILFASTSSYDKAIKLSGRHLGKRYLTIQAAQTPRTNGSSSSLQATRGPPPPDCRTLFVGNLPYDATEEDIARCFDSYGVTITEQSVRIARNSVTRQSKGFCYIDFESAQDAQKIMKSDRQLTVKGRIPSLDWDTGRMKGSFRSGSGRLWNKEIKEAKKTRAS
mmetsp:Transcript_94279/g.271662  ORF Transcript_94279/g.271662 Transcript_94279/m.271662 type:complete len:286 (+) Transcript_94279:59-916(+)